MNFVAYVVYGKNEDYFLSAKFSILSVLANNTDELKIVVLTDNENYFQDLPIITLPLSQLEKDSWSLNDRYHFRIKNRGLKKIIDFLSPEPEDKIIAFDTDTYFNAPIKPLYDLITKSSSVMFRNEGRIRKNIRFKTYYNVLSGRNFQTPLGKNYTLSDEAEMWGALLCGIQVNNVSILDEADDIMLLLLNHVASHTIEQFALAETIKAHHQIHEGKAHVLNYSSSGKKRHAIKIIRSFFASSKQYSYEELAQRTKDINLKRNFFQLIRSRYERYFLK